MHQDTTARGLDRRAVLGAGLAAAVSCLGLSVGAVADASPKKPAPRRLVVWSKAEHRVYLVEGPVIVTVLKCLGNADKTPDGTYYIESWSRAASYYEGQQVWLNNFGPFYRRPGHTWNIGFHAIPVWATGKHKGQPIHKDSLLGGGTVTEGCVRLSQHDSAVIRAFAKAGTAVVVTSRPYGVPADSVCRMVPDDAFDLLSASPSANSRH